MIDRDMLTAIPGPEVASTDEIRRGIDASIAYLDSDAALESIALDVYWPKWDSPWWHMLLLHELGETARIPARAIAALVAGLDALPLHVFPIDPGDAPPGTDLERDVSCHCALGCNTSVLSACGVDVDRALPWIAPWFARYQMADGGYSCDETAYRVADECPSSMVGTIAPFEAMLARGGSRGGVVDRIAGFLIDRALTRGSSTAHNADERVSAVSWPQLTFPRFYFYDVLRGLAALVRWAERGHALPWAAIAGAVEPLARRFPDGVVRVERRAFDDRTTIVPTADRSPSPRVAAWTFPLLDAVSVIGAPSAALTRQWTEARRGLVRLIDAGRLELR